MSHTKKSVKTPHKQHSDHPPKKVDVHKLAAMACRIVQPKTAVAVDSKDGVDVKMVRAPSEREFTRSMFGTKPWKTIVCRKGTNTSSTNTALTSVAAVDCGTSGGMTNISDVTNLFDEARIVSTQIVFAITSNAAPSSVTATAGVAFDPDSAAVYGSVAGVLTATKHAGPIFLGATNQAIWPQQVSRNGTDCKSGPLIRPVSINTPAGFDVVQGAWYATTQASAIGGYWKFYVDALGTSVTSTITYFIHAEMELRMRT